MNLTELHIINNIFITSRTAKFSILYLIYFQGVRISRANNRCRGLLIPLTDGFRSSRILKLMPQIHTLVKFYKSFFYTLKEAL
jgi:hypothetical protein